MTKTNVWTKRIATLLMVVGILVMLYAAARWRWRPTAPPAATCPTPQVYELSEDWRFRTDPDDIGVEQTWFAPGLDDDAWDAMTPGRPWEYDGLDYDGIAWYRTRITLPDWPAIYLGFGGLDDAATLWIDGQEAGSWDIGTERAIVIDLLDYGEPGAEMTLALRVDDRGGYGGIKQPLRLGCEPRLVMSDKQYMLYLSDQHPDWPLPSWTQGGPLAWTMTGLPDAADEALVSIDGAVAPWATAPLVEAWLYDPGDGALYAGSQQEVTFSLVDDRLPLPQWTWSAAGVTLDHTLFGDTRDGAVRWRISTHNPGEQTREVQLVLIVRPLAINRTLAPICAIGLQDTSRLWVDGQPFALAATPPDQAGVGTLEESMQAILAGRVPAGTVITSTVGQDGAAVWQYTLQLAPGAETVLDFAFPPAPGAEMPAAANTARRLDQTIAMWEETLGQVTFDLPDETIENGITASTGYLMLALDPDGPHPGPLAHDALWVRDAAYIGLALLQSGHAEAVAGYIPSLVDAQEPDGRMPPIQGENVPWDDEEWDAQGQTAFLIAAYYRYTDDREALRNWYPTLRAAAHYIVTLRDEQAETEGPAAGLLPPSKSAEDIGPPDWHHYWDNFWAVAGLEEAAYAASVLGESEDAAWMAAEAEDLRAAILDSIEAVMGPEPAYIPGAVEGTDSSAMARGTVTALWPVEVLDAESPLIERSFDYYHQTWIAPYEGGFLHREGQFWTYGGLELAHAYLRLGRSDVLHQILGWSLTHQTLPGTYAWAEQVSPASGGFSGGDMPHAWAAASYVTLIREMVVMEQDEALVLFAGTPEWWFAAGQTITIEEVPTYYGPLTLHTESTLQQDDDGWHGTLTLDISGATPAEGFRWQVPDTPVDIDGPAGTTFESGWLAIPATGGQVTLTFE